jgi:Xaa-Pro aminopeptidase
MAQRKTKKELAAIREACRITDVIFSRITIGLRKREWKTERELYIFILAEIKKWKLKPSFTPIVTSGKNAGSEIHPKVTDTPLQGFLILDFGVIYNGQMSDMTRTVYIGAPSKSDQTLYELLLESQEKSMALLIPGAKCFLADLYARHILGRYAKYFIHTLGHGVGSRIHEAPRIFYKRTRSYVREGMALTVEPGIYIKNRLGMRIEDTCEITANGPKPLTRSAKSLLVFPIPR